MKAVILAGGKGTRLSEETTLKPKPMVEIGGIPILKHIMDIYARQGIREFIVCLGYKGYMIRDYFLNYHLHHGDIEVNLSSGSVTHLSNDTLDWKVSLVDTGLETETAGRLRRVSHLIGSSDFFFTYGDGVSDLNVLDVLETHRLSASLVTLTAVSPDARYGALELEGAKVAQFAEKPSVGEGLINGGFFVMDPLVLSRIESDKQSFERDILPGLVREGKVAAHAHTGFWRSMDTLRDAIYLRELWDGGDPPWIRAGK